MKQDTVVTEPHLSLLAPCIRRCTADGSIANGGHCYLLDSNGLI